MKADDASRGGSGGRKRKGGSKVKLSPLPKPLKTIPKSKAA